MLILPLGWLYLDPMLHELVEMGWLPITYGHASSVLDTWLGQMNGTQTVLVTIGYGTQLLGIYEDRVVVNGLLTRVGGID
jgi:hypothetical protein